MRVMTKKAALVGTTALMMSSAAAFGAEYEIDSQDLVTPKRTGICDLVATGGALSQDDVLANARVGLLEGLRQGLVRVFVADFLECVRRRDSHSKEWILLQGELQCLDRALRFSLGQRFAGEQASNNVGLVA